MPRLTSKSFADFFNEKEDNLPFTVKQAIKETNFKYKVIEGQEYSQAILKILKILDGQTLKVSGPHRLNDWEKGWNSHLEELKESKYNLDILVAKFAMKGEYNRLQGNLIKVENNSFESDFVNIIRLYLFNKYYKNINTLYEFGAGTGVNLVAASKIFPRINLVGLDWANSSIEIINSLKEKLRINISGKRMDFFNPDKKYKLNKNSAILTIGTLEQLGKDFKSFINYLLENRPTICIHLETLYELYDQDNLLDYLAAKYLEKRKYLRGFLPFLRDLERKKKIKIFEIRRTFGSLYHEGYTYIVWKPI